MSHFVVTLGACGGPGLQSLYLFKDEVDLSLRSFIAVVAPADTESQPGQHKYGECLGLSKEIQTVLGMEELIPRLEGVRRDHGALMCQLAAQSFLTHINKLQLLKSHTQVRQPLFTLFYTDFLYRRPSSSLGLQIC